MADSVETIVIAAFGDTAADATLVVGYSDQVDDDLLEYSPVHLLACADGVCRPVETIDSPIVDAWSSPSGATYFVSASGFVETRLGGDQTREHLGEGEQAPSCILGFAGGTPDDDTLIVCSDRRLYVRSASGWQGHDLPDDIESVKAIHGLAPDAVYLCSDGEGLHLWNGESFSFIEGPAEEPLGVLVYGPDELFMTADGVYVLAGGTWTEMESPSSPTCAIALLDGSLYVGSHDGVLQRRGRKLELVWEGYCNSLVVLGESLLACGPDDGPSLFNGKSWRPLIVD